MKASDVQVVRCTPTPGVYPVSSNRGVKPRDTLDWQVWFFKSLAPRSGVWADLSGHRFAAATCWAIRPKQQTEAAVIDELKRQAAVCGYGKIEIINITPPRVNRQ